MQDSRYKSNQNAYQLLAFKKSIKREVSQCTMLKDEKYFEAFKRNLLVTAVAHGCEEILEGDYMPGYDDDSQELFKQKQFFMCSVFNRKSVTKFKVNNSELFYFITYFLKYYKVTWVKP